MQRKTVPEIFLKIRNRTKMKDLATKRRNKQNFGIKLSYLQVLPNLNPTHYPRSLNYQIFTQELKNSNCCLLLEVQDCLFVLWACVSWCLFVLWAGAWCDSAGDWRWQSKLDNIFRVMTLEQQALCVTYKLQ